MDTEKNICCCYSLRALDIMDYGKRCRRYLSIRAPNIKWALLSLEALAVECKTMIDNNGLEYDTFPLFHFLKELPVSLPFEIKTVSLITKLKYLYFKRKLLCILNDNFFNEYIEVVKVKLKGSIAVSEIEILLNKFLKVCNVLPLQLELSQQDIHQYEFMAELLNLCYDMNIQDSQLVLALLKMTIDRYMIELYDTRHVRQPFYRHGFFKYILELITKEKFHLERYCISHPRTIWAYSRNFSVVNAVSFGNMDRTLSLLQHGFEVFPESEVKKCGHGFPFIEENMPPTYLMIFQMMSSMRSVNLFILNSTQISDYGLYTVSNDQKECFRIVWRAIPAPYVKHAQLATAITTEYFHLAKYAIINPMRYEKNTKFCIMYETCFMDMTAGPIEPRSLKHLCRCKIRNNLRKQWRLPSGICQLGLPNVLESYLNLESD